MSRANDRLARVEQIKRFRVLDRGWQPGDPELTATHKLRRAVIATRYADVIEELYVRET